MHIFNDENFEELNPYLGSIECNKIVCYENKIRHGRKTFKRSKEHILDKIK
jgi:hypothetical protein